jgi:hypothetical protein
MGLKDFQQIKLKFGSLLSRLFTATLKPDDYKKAFEPESDDIKTIIDFS